MSLCYAVPSDAEETNNPPPSESTELNSENFQIPVYSNDVAAIVNNEIITVTQLTKEMAPFIPRIRAESGSQTEFQKKFYEYQKVVLNVLIERILIVADFKSKGGKLPDNYEQKEYEAFVDNKTNGDRTALAKLLREDGRSVREFKKSIREHIIINFVLDEVTKLKSEISPAKIKEYYDEHSKDFTIDRKIFVKGVILEKQKYDDSELQSKLTSLKQAIQSGDSAQTIIENFTDFPKASQFEWVSVGDLIPVFSDALSDLQVGQFTQPLEVNGRIYLLFVVDEKPAKIFTLDEAKDNIEDILTEKYQMESKKKFIERLREKAYIKTFI
ncbi:MAG: peptidylprolyl isomerase [Puniceicoccales bacterium]|nr:peptidylprolyl isomerase [Puniceicoccales bacterium]